MMCLLALYAPMLALPIIHAFISLKLCHLYLVHRPIVCMWLALNYESMIFLVLVLDYFLVLSFDERLKSKMQKNMPFNLHFKLKLGIGSAIFYLFYYYDSFM